MTLTRDNPTDFNHPMREERINRVWGAILPHLDLQNKRVVDLGCGWGWFGKKCAEWGAKVTFIDGRKENLDKCDIGPEHIYLHRDIDSPYWYPPFSDITLCLGLLYHTSDPSSLLRKMSLSSVIVLDSMCLDFDGELLVKFEEDTSQLDYSLTGGACRPSPKWIVKNLEDMGYQVEELSVPSIEPTGDWPGAIWNWDYERTCGWRRNGSQLWKLYLARS